MPKLGKKKFPYSNKGKVAAKKAAAKKLLAKQEQALQKHKEHHSPQHMAMMKKMMKGGASFKDAHESAMKKVGA